jgi:hypothetical protein
MKRFEAIINTGRPDRIKGYAPFMLAGREWRTGNQSDAATWGTYDEARWRSFLAAREERFLVIDTEHIFMAFEQAHQGHPAKAYAHIAALLRAARVEWPGVRIGLYFGRLVHQLLDGKARTEHQQWLIHRLTTCAKLLHRGFADVICPELYVGAIPGPLPSASAARVEAPLDEVRTVLQHRQMVEAMPAFLADFTDAPAIPIFSTQMHCGGSFDWSAAMPLPVYHHAVEAIAAAFPAAAWWGGVRFEKSLTQKYVGVKTWAEEAHYFGQPEAKQRGSEAAKQG